MPDYHFDRCDAFAVGSLTALLDHSFNIQNPAKEALVNWTFFAAAHHQSTICYTAITADNCMVSQYANVPIALHDNGNALNGMVCVDMTTHRDHRGKRLISQLAERVYADVVAAGFDLSIGFSSEAGIKVDQNATGYGYQVVGRYVRHVYPLWRPQVTPYTLTPAPSFSEMPDKLLLMPGDPLGIAKTADYLTWRYVEKPCNDYQIYRLNNVGAFAGYVVIRPSSRGAYIYDLIADFTDFNLIRAAVHNLLLARHQSTATWYVLDNHFWRRSLRGSVRIPNHFAIVDRAALLSAENWRMMASEIL